ncbi:MAG TPA: D-Ala-D-Ala carboxypeptidase family metallohydrolase [Burkholderiales bacterium]|nr:D-Ala-D-Ala carboxypeptidase family metallohydrolase [Burkholderiales bacterium]
MLSNPSRRLSQYFTLAQLTRSETARQRGIDNTPPAALLSNLERLAAGLDAVQALLGHPLEISSAYRCPALNEAVGGTAHSQHCQGLAADFVCPGYGEPPAVAQAIATSALDFDQCILEFGRWVHLSFSPTPRRRLLSIYSSREGYLDGLIDAGGTRLA